MRIALSRKNYPIGTMATVTGWGNLKENGISSDVLMKVVIPIVDHQKCEQNYKHVHLKVTNNELCAGSLNGGKSSNLFNYFSNLSLIIIEVFCNSN